MNATTIFDPLEMFTKLEISKAARTNKKAKGTKLATSKAARATSKAARATKTVTTKKPTWFKGSQRKVTVERIVAALKSGAMTVNQLAKTLRVSHTGAQNYILVARKLGKVRLVKGKERQGKRGPLAITFTVA